MARRILRGVRWSEVVEIAGCLFLAAAAFIGLGIAWGCAATGMILLVGANVPDEIRRR